MNTRTITAYNVDNPGSNNHAKTCEYVEVTECPTCHFAIEPKPLEAYFDTVNLLDYPSYALYLVCQCKKCRQVFLSKFSGATRASSSSVVVFRSTEYSIPFTPRVGAIPESIQAISPGFAETYQQAEIAEAQQLMQICGVGYRKALEFLIKDYLCHMHPEDTDEIQAEFLGKSLKRIDDHRIKALAERSAWIGNDETHYVRKHENLDISDMKRFIQAMLRYIESELAFEEALSIEPK